jgi:CheY-like chemotaxis protein
MFESKSLLLAEDSPQDAELVMEALADHYLANRVIRVKDGVEALEYLRCEGEYATRRSGHPAVVVLDIKMPRMNGLETLRAIRADPALKLIPVVMLTSSHENPDMVRSYELGSNAYVVKPMIFSDFVATVKQLGAFWAKLNELPPDRSLQSELVT